MSFLRAITVVLVTLAPAWAEDVRAQQSFSIPYGTGAGSVARESGEPTREYSGPSSLRVGPTGEILVVDAMGHRVLRFAPGGALLGTVTIPAANAHDAETVPVDAAQDASRNLHVLELSDRTVLRFAADGKPAGATPVPLPEGSSAILNALTISPAGDVLVFDGFDNRVIQVGAGKSAPTAPGLAQGLALDAASRFLYLDLPDPSSAKTFTVWHVDPATAKKEQPAAVTLPEPGNEFHLLGTDSAGRLYVEVAYGAVENPRDRHVLVLSPTGQILERVPVPAAPTAFRMISARAVLPQGGLLTASDSPAGLVISFHAVK